MQSKQVGKNFGILVVTPGPSTTKFIVQMALISKLLLSIDAFLLSPLKFLKFKLSHIIPGNGILGGRLYVVEDLGLSGEVQTIITEYLRKGKELILSYLPTVDIRENFIQLQQELTVLLNEAEQRVTKQLSLDLPICTAVPEIDLIRILHKIWDFYNGHGRSVSIKVISLVESPPSFFKVEPPFAQWIDSINDETTETGLFRLQIANFEDGKKWKGRIINSGVTNAVDLVVSDPKFFEEHKSSIKNISNGLLIGDVLKAKFRILDDPIHDRTTYEIVQVEELIRADLFVQDELFD